jgi:hypothetical protein
LAIAGDATTSGAAAIAAAHPKSTNLRITNTISSQTTRPTPPSLTPWVGPLDFVVFSHWPARTRVLVH